MGKIAKYEAPPALGSGRTWKETLLIPVFIFALFTGGVAILKWRDPSRDLERSHLYGTAYSHAAIRAITGGTSNVSFALIPKEERRLFGRGVPEDWKRKKEEDVIHGTARMLIFGKDGGGIFRISYRYIPSVDSFTVLRIENLDRVLHEEGPSSQHSQRRAADAARRG